MPKAILEEEEVSPPSLIWKVGGQSGEEIKDINLTWSNYIPIAPTPKQLAFLLLPCLEALYGGAGGGGKSTCLLSSALQYVDTPGYSSLILRKTFTDLSLPGALMDVAHTWLDRSDASWSELDKSYTFPSGSTLTFGYLDSYKDRYRYQSAAFQFIGFDELTQFEISAYTYMFSRLRRLSGSEIPLRMRAASNPGGIGHDWVNERFLLNAHEGDRVFVPAGLRDNPYIDADTYEMTLQELDPITRRQILDGDWTARQGGSKFRREWFEIVDVAPAELRSVRRWDMAATEPKKGKDPDWTVGLKLGITKNNVLYIEDVQRMRGSPGKTEALIVQTAKLDGKQTMIRMEQEPGSSGVKAIDDYKRRVLMGYTFSGVLSTGSKEVRANPVASQAEAGNIKIVRGPWNKAFLEEIESFPSGAHDDQVDALSGALSDLSGDGRPFMIG